MPQNTPNNDNGQKNGEVVLAVLVLGTLVLGIAKRCTGFPPSLSECGRVVLDIRSRPRTQGRAAAAPNAGTGVDVRTPEQTSAEDGLVAGVGR
jgi:hypothetical protein